MTTSDALEFIQQIALSRGDYEHAHSLEDQLRERVLKAIAGGKAEDPVKLAKIALSTSEIQFPRYCA